MSLTLNYDEETTPNPLDIVEQLVTANDWAFDRQSDEDMAVEVPGRWCDYRLFFSWREDIGAMHFTCAFDMKVPQGKKPQIYELLARVNERLWMGHFGIWSDQHVPMFRHAFMLRIGDGASLAQIEDMVDIAVAECERYYPAFQFIIWGGKSAEEAIASAMLDTLGEA